MVGYYDAVLGLIPSTLFGLAGGLYLMGMTLGPAVILGGVFASGLVAHALFVRAPVGAEPGVEPPGDPEGGTELAAD